MDEEGELDTFIGVGSGLKPFSFIKNIGWNSNSSFYFFDTDTAVLNLKECLCLFFIILKIHTLNY